MDNAVIYARYSSSHQREESIEGQVRECTAYAKKQGLNVIQVYADRAISGRTDERPEFQKMIEDSKKRLFSSVIVYTFDRFSRDRYASAVYKHALKKNGVQVLSSKENIDNSPAGVLMESLYEGMAEYYSLELAQKVKRGMTENALAGKWTSGPVPFGFMRDENKKLVKHPVTNKFLYDICKMYDEGANFIDLERYLKSHNIKNSTGREFNKDSFKRILTSPMNIGIFKWNEVIIKNYLEPTIPVEMYDRIQKRLNERKRKGVVNVRRSEEYLLTPHIYCAECGGMMHGISGTSATSGVHYYYACANKRNRKTTCSTPWLNRDILEDAIFEYACSILKSDDNIEQIAEQALAANQASVDEGLIAMQDREKELKKNIANYMKAIEKGVMSDTLIERLNLAEKELADLKNQITCRKLSAPKEVITKQHIIFFLKNLLEMEGENIRKRVLHALVRDVAVENKKDSNEVIVTVRFNYSDTPTLNAKQEFIASVRENSKLVKIRREAMNASNIFFFEDGWQISFIFNKKAKRIHA